MAGVDRLVDDLEWDDTHPDRPMVLIDGSPVAAFERRGPRVATMLELLGGERHVDVSVQPDTIVHLLRGVAVRRRRDGNAWERAVARRLGTCAKEWGLTPACITDNGSLTAMAGSLAFPIVGSAMHMGATAPPFIPRWAEPVLASPNAREAARVAFGSRTTRRLIGSFSASLVGDTTGDPHTIVLVPLALAMAIADTASADVIANLLCSPAANHAPQHWPNVDRMHRLSRGLRLLGDAGPLLATNALGSLDGPRRLADLMVHVPRLLNDDDRPLPRRLDQLQEMIDESVSAAPVPVPAVVRRHDPPLVEPVEQAPVERVAACDVARVIVLPAQPLYAPVEMAPAGEPPISFHYPEAVRRLEGGSSGDHSIHLPRNRAELISWGRILNNCMADYCNAVAQGTSVVLGLERGDKLVAGVELTTDLTCVRQFVRDNNHRPWRAERDAITKILTRLGVGGG